MSQMAKWKYSYKNQEFGIFPKGTKVKTFSGGSTTKNQIQCGQWTLRASVSDYIPNGKKHAQRTIKSGKNPDELYDLMIKIIDCLSPDEIGKVNPIMNAKKVVNAKG
jgi:hypothetical protein